MLIKFNLQMYEIVGLKRNKIFTTSIKIVIVSHELKK
jgi:hypothetical protein